jgi:Fe-S cluster biogenesis protein NfuA/nitrite reductase/ring-hydroxylating ferredoxin subunit
MAGRASEFPDENREGQWRTAGDRIQVLLDASAAGGPVARERAEQLVREVVDLYGAALERVIALTDDPTLIERFVHDDLVASLLLVHGLHPHDIERRIGDALARVRPYLGSHGGDVALLEVADGATGMTVRLQFSGSCKSCPSSAVTLELTVEDAIRAAAPEISAIEVVAAEPSPDAGPVIPIESLMSRLHVRGHGATTWHQVPALAELTPGEVGGFVVADVTVLACRVGDELFAYVDRCGSCTQSLAGAALHRPMGSPVGTAVLRCPRCHAHFDVVHAGICVDQSADAGTHLAPIPLLVRDGVLCIAMVEQAAGAGMA